MNKLIYFFITFAGIIGAAIVTLIYEKKTKWEGNDERQILESLKSSTIGFYILIVLNLISFVAIRDLELPFAPEMLILISIVVAVSITLVRDIWIENIYSNKVNMKFIFVFISILLVVVEIKLLKAYKNDSAIENFILALTLATGYFACTFTFFMKFIQKKFVSSKEVE